MAGASYVAIRMEITNQEDIDALDEVIEELEERHDDCPWMELGALADELKRLKRNLDGRQVQRKKNRK